MSVTHRVAPGQSAGAIVWAYGHDDFDAVWSSAANATLRERRPDPNMLMPGDKLVVPERKPRVYVLETGKRHRIIIPIPRKELRLRVLVHEEEPLANASYRLTLEGSARLRTGTTDEKGFLREKIRVNIPGGMLEIDGRRFRLRFNYIHPLPSEPTDAATGVSSRLANLGYESGNASKQDSPALASALALYQIDAGLEATGKLDADTGNRLARDFGC